MRSQAELCLAKVHVTLWHLCSDSDLAWKLMWAHPGISSTPRADVPAVLQCRWGSEEGL